MTKAKLLVVLILAAAVSTITTQAAAADTPTRYPLESIGVSLDGQLVGFLLGLRPQAGTQVPILDVRAQTFVAKPSATNESYVSFPGGDSTVRKGLGTWVFGGMVAVHVPKAIFTLSPFLYSGYQQMIRQTYG